MVEKRGFKKRKQLGKGKRHKELANDDHKDPEKEDYLESENHDLEDVTKDAIKDAHNDDKDTDPDAQLVKKRKPNGPSNISSFSSDSPGPEMLALTNAHGPKNIRTTTITDFQPDVCKDFLQTGYCGYGDTCKFIHVRNESTQKKPVRRDWEISTSKPSSEGDIGGKELPFKCAVCKKDYDQPVETKCSHVFCKKCFMDRYKKGKTRCYICQEETNGIISPYKVDK
ncbi:RNA-splicing factor [Scheffersomyces spartinae]|uniref:Pre-mRNA-splicing factor CWC24 n=1 Tax=Scheffersomyces spartinae TaxID=45513 RepID=A0A9P7VBK0_9ASCO|nr:RNA-splicing factor [Scheffersomyces spartinae]KAG7194511.1 RNA-splicing factor [Scheffersomyces spartinae]